MRLIQFTAQKSSVIIKRLTNMDSPVRNRICF